MVPPYDKLVMLSHLSDKHITGIWSTLVIGSCFQSCMGDRTDWGMYEASQWHFRVPRQKGTDLKLMNSLVFYKIELEEKNQYIISFHCALVFISFAYLWSIDIVEQVYRRWYSYITSNDNDINLSRLVSDTWFNLWLVICLVPNHYQN